MNAPKKMIGAEGQYKSLKQEGSTREVERCG